MRYNQKTHEAQSLGFGVVLLLAASALFSTHAGAAPTSAAANLDAMPVVFPQQLGQLGNVVQITATAPATKEAPKGGSIQSLGVYLGGGLVLTSNDAIAPESWSAGYLVKLADGRTLKASGVKQRPWLALLKLESIPAGLEGVQISSRTAAAGEPVAAVGMASAGFADAFQFHTVAQGYVSSVPFLAAQENPEAAPLVAVSTSIQADYTGAPVFSRDEHGKPVELLGVVVNDRGSLLMVPASSFADAAAQQVSMANR